MVSLLLLLLACSGAPSTEAPAPAPSPEPEAPAIDEPAEADEAPPAGVVGGSATGAVGGMPILERPVILGGIENAQVEAALDTEALQACNTAGRAGKVLLRFRIDKGGQVVSVETRSTTLRHPETEACVEAALRATVFPALERGESAIVTWPVRLRG